MANARRRKPAAPKRPSGAATARPRSSSAAGQESEIARLGRDLSESLEQQTAASEILKIISSSKTELQPVLDTVVANATHLCRAVNATIFLRDGESMVIHAQFGPPGGAAVGTRRTINRDWVAGRATLEAKTIQVAAEILSSNEYPEGREISRRLGHRVILAVPLMRDAVAVGAILATRREAQPFSERQIALLQNFAAQAVIAIENARLLTELRQRTDQLGERKKIEEALKLSDQRYRFVFDFLPMALWRINTDGTLSLLQDLRRRGIVDLGKYLDEHPDVVYQAMNGTRVTEVNQRAVQLFGARDPREMLGAVTRFWKNNADGYRKILAARFNGEEALQIETQLTTLDGRTIEGLYFFMAFPLALNAPGVSLGGFLDETDRLRVQSRLAAIISSLSDAVISKTPDGIVTSWNEGAEKMFGYEAREMIGQSITRIIPPELQDEEREILRRLRQGERIKNYETVRNCKDGRRIDVSLAISPRFDQSGKVVGASKVARDVTAEKLAEAELQRVREELARVARITTLGELTAAIAHEVNQPLTGVVNSGNACLRWLSQETPNVAAARESVERMITSGNRAAEVIKRIRALIAKTPSQRYRLSINEAIAEVLALVQGELQRKSILLRTDLSSDVPGIFGDRIQLQQVILNLTMNAIDAMSGVLPPRDLLVTSSKNETNDVLVTVRDTGTGFDEKSLDRIFEAFYTTKAQGMGVGLAVSRTIVQTHGGQL